MKEGSTKKCPDCGATIGSHHSVNCDVDRCQNTGHQRLACNCCGDKPTGIWTGFWPGVLECQKYGLYSKLVFGRWVKTTEDDPEGSEDLNTLIRNGKWNKEKQRWEMKEVGLKKEVVYV